MISSLHKLITEFSPLEKPTQHVANYLEKHPALYKTILIANHIFRAAAMVGLHQILPLSRNANWGSSFVGSLIYRVTVEKNCAFKFALPSFAGSLALPIGKRALSDLINGVAFASKGKFASTLGNLLPLAGYLTYVALTVSYDVDHMPKEKCCNSSKTL